MEEPDDDDSPWLSPDGMVKATCKLASNLNGAIKDYTGIDVLGGAVWMFDTAVDACVSLLKAVAE